MGSPNKRHRDLRSYRKASIYTKLREARLINNKKLFESLKREGISFDLLFPGSEE